MQEHAIQYQQSYENYRAELNHELNRAAEGFVRIGYLLKVARDTDILKDSKYETYTEFAQGEFGLDKSQVSRFIQINDRFSEGGNSDHLLPKYKGFGSAKLTLMLALPDEINEELTPEYSKAEIQTIKEEVEEEQKITPIEVMLEEKQTATEELSLLAKILYHIGETEPDLMAEMIDMDYLSPNPSDRRLMEMLAPAGQKMYMVRIPGEGRYALNINGDSGSITNVRDSKKESITMDMVSRAMGELYTAYDPDARMDLKDGKAVWSLIYKQDFPEMKVAPVQQKKESKVVPVKKEEKKPEKKVPESVPKVPEKEEKGDWENKKETDSRKPYEKPVLTEYVQEGAKDGEGQDEGMEMENPEDDKYEYMEPDETIEALEELMEDYEKAVKKEWAEKGKEPLYVSVDIDQGYARGIYNAIKELQYMKKLGGSRR